MTNKDKRLKMLAQLKKLKTIIISFELLLGLDEMDSANMEFHQEMSYTNFIFLIKSTVEELVLILNQPEEFE